MSPAPGDTSPCLLAEQDLHRPQVSRLRPVLLVVLLAAGLGTLALPPVRALLGPTGIDDLRAAAEQSSVGALLTALLVASGLVALGAPRLLLAGIAGAALGGVLGGSLATLAGVLGSLITFAGARWLGRDWIRARLGGEVRYLDSAVRSRGLLVTVLLRTSPIGFGHATNLALAVSAVSVGDFVIGTILGVAPSTFVVACMGSTAAAGAWPTLASLAVLLVALVVVLKRLDLWTRLVGPRPGVQGSSTASDPDPEASRRADP